MVRTRQLEAGIVTSAFPTPRPQQCCVLLVRTFFVDICIDGHAALLTHAYPFEIV